MFIAHPVEFSRWSGRGKEQAHFTIWARGGPTRVYLGMTGTAEEKGYSHVAVSLVNEEDMAGHVAAQGERIGV